MLGWFWGYTSDHIHIDFRRVKKTNYSVILRLKHWVYLSLYLGDSNLSLIITAHSNVHQDVLKGTNSLCTPGCARHWVLL